MSQKKKKENTKLNDEILNLISVNITRNEIISLGFYLIKFVYLKLHGDDDDKVLIEKDFLNKIEEKIKIVRPSTNVITDDVDSDTESEIHVINNLELLLEDSNDFLNYLNFTNVTDENINMNGSDKNNEIEETPILRYQVTILDIFYLFLNNQHNEFMTKLNKLRDELVEDLLNLVYNLVTGKKMYNLIRTFIEHDINKHKKDKISKIELIKKINKNLKYGDKFFKFKK